MREYDARYLQEAFEIMESIKRRTLLMPLSKNLHKTPLLCRCLLLSIFQLIRGAFACASVRSRSGLEALLRSIIEHVIDLKLIALRNDAQSNRRFALISRILLYDGRFEIQTMREHIPEIERRYKEYVLREFPEIAETGLEQIGSFKHHNWLQIHDNLKKKGLSRHWSGKSFYARVEEIVQLLALYEPGEKGAQIWNRARTRALKHSAAQWPNLEFPEKLARILSEIPKKFLRRDVEDLLSLDHLLPSIMLSWNYYSVNTHPTPYSSIPHYSPSKETFEFEHNHPDSELQSLEETLLLLLDYSCEAFSYCLEGEERPAFRKNFYKHVRSARHYGKWFFDKHLKGKVMQLVLATNNEDKIREIKLLLDDLPVTVLTRDDFLEFPDVEETGETLEENAILKARAIAEFSDLPALADDSGLEVDALDGAPGVRSSRYAGENVTYADNNKKLLHALEGLPREMRAARFRCVIAVAWSPDEVQTVEGSAEGFITEELAGREGFGYDPVFYYPPAHKRFSQMTLDEKNAVSHRGRALQEARTLIFERLNAAGGPG